FSVVNVYLPYGCISPRLKIRNLGDQVVAVRASTPSGSRRRRRVHPKQLPTGGGMGIPPAGTALPRCSVTSRACTDSSIKWIPVVHTGGPDGRISICNRRTIRCGDGRRYLHNAGTNDPEILSSGCERSRSAASFGSPGSSPRGEAGSLMRKGRNARSELTRPSFSRKTAL